MNQQALVISVRLLDDRYHGEGTWPPSPFRLFQALVAAAFTGSTASDKEAAALRWLEQLPPPVVLSPTYQQSALTTYYVPRNGADAQQGNLDLAAKKRDAKLAKPWLFDGQQPLHYVWFFAEHDGEVQTLTELSERLYQLGRGVDMAFAWAEQLAADQAEEIIIQHAGAVFRPTPQGVSNTLDCPSPGQSFNSLLTRYHGQLKRLRKGEFHKPPLPVSQPTGYNCPSSLLLFDIQNQNGEFAAQPLTAAAPLTKRLIELAKSRLKAHFPEYAERFLAGIGANDADKALRIRVIPLPSLGHQHTNQDIRRVLVEVPTDCPLQLADVEWAFSGLPLEIDLETGEIDPNTPVLTKAIDHKMLAHYGIAEQEGSRIWRTVTPVALPVGKNPPAESGAERVLKHNQLYHAAYQALRHCGIDLPMQIRNIQREPFDRNGTIAEHFAFQRFDRNKLYHLQLEFAEPCKGPLILGDARFQGLGLMRPMDGSANCLIQFHIVPDNQPAVQDRPAFVLAIRRALMSLARQTLGEPGLLFSGHEADGAVSRTGKHRHIFIAALDNNKDGLIDRLLVIAPWHADRSLRPNPKLQQDFQSVLGKLNTIRAGALGIIKVDPIPYQPDDNGLLTGCGRDWQTLTPYQPTRYPKSNDQGDFDIISDVLNECRRRSLPKPTVRIIETQKGPNGGIRAHIRLNFATAVHGPLLLGRESHSGGGLFAMINGIAP